MSDRPEDTGHEQHDHRYSYADDLRLAIDGAIDALDKVYQDLRTMIIMVRDMAS